MNCLRCNEAVNCDRVVVVVRTGFRLGGYCESCEREDFGRSLERGWWRDRLGCILCEGQGTHVLPVHEIEYVETDSGERRQDGYVVTPETPRLCTDHVEELFDVEIPHRETKQASLSGVDSPPAEIGLD